MPQFCLKGYIGFSTNYAEADQFDAYIQNLPGSLFINSSFPLYVFLFLIAYIPAYQFFSTGSEDRILRQAKIRYFRIMPPIYEGLVKAYVSGSQYICVSWVMG